MALTKLYAESNHRLYGSFVAYLVIHGFDHLPQRLLYIKHYHPSFQPSAPPEAPPLFWDVG